ncbi:MAG TPA: hypothetical protein VGE94_08030 [Chloroflexota bacterium]
MTNGELMEGVRYFSTGAVTQSLRDAVSLRYGALD